MQCSHRTKIALISVSIFLLLGVVVFVAVFLTLPNARVLTPLPARLAEVSLEEGETLTYRVDQYTEVETGGVQNVSATIRAIVGIRVLNKTAEEYWFLMKFNLSDVRGNVADLGDVKTVAEYFLVRLPIDSRTNSIDVYGNHSTNEEQLRLVISITHQLFPAVERKLYEHVDGKKATGSNSLTPEESPLLPGSVKMHRQANTLDKDKVSIRNHFDHSDFVNMASEIELNMDYFDFASISKSNGMILDSQVHLSVHLKFGVILNDTGGVNNTMMKATVIDHVSLIRTQHFTITESESANFLSFVKLDVANATTFPERFPSFSTSGETASNVSLTTGLNNSINSSMTSEDCCGVWRKAELKHTIQLFRKKVFDIPVHGTAEVSVKSGSVAVQIILTIGKGQLTVLNWKHSIDQLLEKKITLSVPVWKGQANVLCIPVYILHLRIDFFYSVKIGIEFSFPQDENSLDCPVKFTVQMKPFAEVKASIEGSVSILLFKAGAFGDGTVMRLSLPVDLSFFKRKWCLNVSAELTALELNAGIFYKTFWGPRRTVHKFGSWSALNKNWNVLEKCTELPPVNNHPCSTPNLDANVSSTGSSLPMTTINITTTPTDGMARTADLVITKAAPAAPTANILPTPDTTPDKTISDTSTYTTTSDTSTSDTSTYTTTSDTSTYTTTSDSSTPDPSTYTTISDTSTYTTTFDTSTSDTSTYTTTSDTTPDITTSLTTAYMTTTNTLTTPDTASIISTSSTFTCTPNTTIPASASISVAANPCRKK